MPSIDHLYQSTFFNLEGEDYTEYGEHACESMLVAQFHTQMQLFFLYFLGAKVPRLYTH